MSDANLSSSEYELSIHDNFVPAYEVDWGRRQIILHTIYKISTPPEYTDVVFDGVMAYHIESDSVNSLLFDIEESRLEWILPDYEDFFERRKRYGWCGFSYQSIEELGQQIEQLDAKFFKIESKCGMDGFILAREMRLVPSDPKRFLSEK